MKKQAQVISDLVAINHSFATMEMDIFTIEIKEGKFYLFPRSRGNVFYRISQISKVLNRHGFTWYMRTEVDGSMRLTAWE